MDIDSERNQILTAVSDGGVVFEGMTSVSALINAARNGKNKRDILKVLIDRSRTDRRELTFLRSAAKELGFAVELCDEVIINAVANGKTHGGVIAICSEAEIPSLCEKNIISNGIYYMFEGIEDPFNFGFAIRSVYAAGADGIIIDERNWMSAAGTVARSSAGASELIDMYRMSAYDASVLFKRMGYRVVCAGIRDSVSVFDTELNKPLFVIIGGEKRGISRKVLDEADDIIRIDYGRNFRGSLPSASAAAVISFEILRKNR